MNEQVKELLEKYSDEIRSLFAELRNIIIESIQCEPKEVLWAKIPTYYVDEAFIRLIPFNDHINIEARATIQHKDELTGYKITPKGMVQIFLTQDIPHNVLKNIFKETLNC